jgi:hypothetical protein
MRRATTKFLMGLLVLACLALPASAGTWRSTSGNMFHFYGGGYMEAYVSGSSYSGSWWWTNNPYQFQYSVNGWSGYGTVDIKGQGAVCYVPGQSAQYWTQLGSRGGETDKPDETSWFLETVAP